MLLVKIVDKFGVRNTHHFIAFEAAKLLGEWFRVFLKYYDDILRGSKDPDKKFHDWNNHIFHPPNYGGAPSATAKVYSKMVEALKRGDYRQFVYLAGVASHYVADVLHPLHTGQTEEETRVHKFHEFGTSLSIQKYRALLKHAKPVVIMDITLFVADLGKFSHEYYYEVLENYDYRKGFQFHWDLGISERLHEINVMLISKAIWAVASLYLSAIEESGAEPPRVSLSIQTILSLLKVPLYIIERWLEKNQMKKITKRMKTEYQKTGKILNSLPPDDKGLVEIFQKMKQEGKLNMRRSKPKTEKQKESPEKQKETQQTSKEHRRYRFLRAEDPIEDAPEIGKRTGEKLRAIGITTIGDLLKMDPKDIAEKLNDRRITTEDVERWQTESKLMMTIPNLRVSDAYFLYRAGIRSREEFMRLGIDGVMRAINEFLKKPEAEKISKYYTPPNRERIEKIMKTLKSYLKENKNN